ncbi:MAG: hypothetical protein V7K59_14715 [Nostoc sp.]
MPIPLGKHLSLFVRPWRSSLTRRCALVEASRRDGGLLKKFTFAKSFSLN